MRRGLIALLAAGLVLVASVAAAAAASGDSPIDLLRAKPAKKEVQRPRKPSSASRAHATSTAPRPSKASAKEEDDQTGDEGQDSKTGPTSPEPAEQKVTICHHTGSWKHPSHAISVDERAVAAHTAHGDSVGACPATPADATLPAKHEKQIAPKRPHHPGNRGRASEHHGRGHGK
jgi:hypothetical protein